MIKYFIKKDFSLEIVVFVTGAVVMVFELAASRILAPYIGTSLITWTSIIGVILGSLSLGYLLGGRLSDKRPSLKIITIILYLSAGCISITAMLNKPVLEFITPLVNDLRLRSLISTILFFSVPSILLGMVSPYAVKLRLNNLNQTGKVSGGLYALATLGSIFGTFLGGFYLIPLIGSTKILFILSLTLISLSLIIWVWNIRIFTFTLLCLLLLLSSPINLHGALVDIDTQYNRVIVFETKEISSGMTTRRLGLNGGKNSSAIYIGDSKLAQVYSEYFDLFEYYTSPNAHVLMIGGGALAYPKHFLDKYPNGKIDVVEIDPALEKIASEYFGLRMNDRIQVYNEDGRIFLANNKTKYDAILVDVFSNGSVPFHLITQEALNSMYNSLKPEGIIIANILSSFEGEKSKMLNAGYWTYKSVFPKLYLFRVYPGGNLYYVQNIMLVALKSNHKIKNKPGFEKLLSNTYYKIPPNNLSILTDDYAPVEDYHLNLWRTN